MLIEKADHRYNMEKEELNSLCVEILNHEKIANLPELQSKLLRIHEELHQPDGTLKVVFSFSYNYNFSTTDFGRFFGYEKTLFYVGHALIRSEASIDDLQLTLTNLSYHLKTNTDLENAETYTHQYDHVGDPLLSVIAPILHRDSKRGPPQFCQFDQIYVQEIEPHDKGSTTYHISYVFDVDGFSQYDKTITFEGYIKVDENGNPVDSKLTEIERGVGL